MSDPDALSLDIGGVPAPRRHRPPRRPPGRPGLRRRRQPSARHRARGAGVVVGVWSHRRRSVVKVAYVRNRRAGAWRAHGAYLARDGAQRPGQRGLGFTASQDDLDLAATLGAWQAAGDARLWKAIISPEQGAELDLRVHARALVRQIGAGRWELSRELEPTLRQCQLAGDIMKSRARHQAHLSDPRLPLVVTRIEAGTRLASRVVGTGLADELRDRRYLLLEGTDRRLHYILQTPDMERARGQARFRVSDHITLTGHAVTREGRTIVTTEIQVERGEARPTGRLTGRREPEPAA